MTVQPVSSAFQSLSVVPTAKELGQDLLKIIETGTMEEIDDFMNSSRMGEIALQDFTQAFHNMAAKRKHEDLHKDFHATSDREDTYFRSELHYADTFSLFIRDPRFSDIRIEEISEALLGATETGNMKCVDTILKSNRAREISVRDFTKAFQNVASRKLEYGNQGLYYRDKHAYYASTFSLFVCDPRFHDIGIEDIIEALLGAAETGSIQCIDVILDSDRAEELEGRTEDLDRIVDALYVNKYGVIETGDFLDTIERIGELNDDMYERLKAELISELSDCIGDNLHPNNDLLKRLDDLYYSGDDISDYTLRELITLQKELEELS